jgi:hypothetical protein
MLVLPADASWSAPRKMAIDSIFFIVMGLFGLFTLCNKTNVISVEIQMDIF